MEKMKAAVLHAVNDLRVEEVDKPVCGPDEVLVKIMYCGICGSDIPRVFFKGTYHFPTIPGHEFSGLVVEDAEGKLVGKRVAVFPLLPCNECEACKQERYATCSNYDYYGSRRDGAYAEYLAVKRWNLVFLPDNVSYEEGAMCEPCSVGRHATMRAEIQEGDEVLISGAGPIGLIAAQWAKSMGAKQVYFFDIDDAKVNFAVSMGFAKYDDAVKVDVVIEGTGNDKALERCLAAAKPFGRVVLMGNPARELVLPQNVYWYILRKELTLKGTWNSSYASYQNDWVEGMKAVSEGRINLKPLITHKVPLDKALDALTMMKDRTEFYNKVMLKMEEDK